MKRFLTLLTACSVLMPPGALAQGALDTLAKIRAAKAITVAFSADSLPFSYIESNNQPAGYSIDLCNAIVEEVTDELGGAELRVVYLVVTPETRFALLQAGDIDLECGSTTANSLWVLQPRR